ncbi:MAG: ribonucleoprotein [Candidatus Lokiarchaeota archaeon]|nr:ribonucleoprotein [Candidatus Lokiarchaeota archaeon]
MDVLCLSVNFFKLERSFLYMSNYIDPKDPLKILNKAVNSVILIRLKDGTEYQGRLKEADSYMNMIIEDAKEIIDGNIAVKYSEIFIRGNNILFIRPNAD